MEIPLDPESKLESDTAPLGAIWQRMPNLLCFTFRVGKKIACLLMYSAILLKELYIEIE